MDKDSSAASDPAHTHKRDSSSARYEPLNRRHDAKEMPFPERLERFTQGDPEQVHYFLRELNVDEATLSKVKNMENFFELIILLLLTGNEEQSFSALLALYELSEMDDVKLDILMKPEILAKIVENLKSDDVEAIHLSLSLIANILDACPAALPGLCELGLLDNLWNVMLHPDSSPELDNDTVFQRSVDDVCNVVDAILAIPECAPCIEALWVTALRLLHVELGVAIRMSITFMTKMLKMGVTNPKFDDETLARLADVGSEGERILRVFFGFLCLLNDNGETWKQLCEHGALENLMHHINDFRDDSFIIYRFFGDIILDPATIPNFLEHTFDFFMNHGSYRVRTEIIGYFLSVFKKLPPGFIQHLTNTGFLSIVTDTAVASKHKEVSLTCLDLISEIIDSCIAGNVKPSSIPELAQLEAELAPLLDSASDSEASEVFDRAEEILARISAN